MAAMPAAGYRALIVLTALYVGIWVNLFWPGLRFDSEVRNIVVFAAAQLIPMAIVVAAPFHTGQARRDWRSIGLMLLLPACPVGFGAAACAVVSNSHGPLDQRRQVVSNEDGTVVVYRSNTSALDDFGITVMQECRIAPGLVVRRLLAGDDPARDARIDMQPSGAVRIVIGTDEERPPVLVHLRRYCWGPSIDRR
jgi:hypothetical protein